MVAVNSRLSTRRRTPPPRRRPSPRPSAARRARPPRPARASTPGVRRRSASTNVASTAPSSASRGRRASAAWAAGAARRRRRSPATRGAAARRWTWVPGPLRRPAPAPAWWRPPGRCRPRRPAAPGQWPAASGGTRNGSTQPRVRLTTAVTTVALRSAGRCRSTRSTKSGRVEVAGLHPVEEHRPEHGTRDVVRDPRHPGRHRRPRARVEDDPGEGLALGVRHHDPAGAVRQRHRLVGHVDQLAAHLAPVRRRTP